jgi:glycosyltransferase involved in cell wall biosynthesis
MKILVVQESNWIDRGPHQSHHIMERLVQRGHEVRVIDFDILWRNKADRELFSHRLEVIPPSKAIEDSKITVIRPPVIHLPVLEYVSLLYSHRKEIRYQLDEFRPDVVIGFGILNAGIAISLCRKRGIRFVYYIIDELHRLVPQPHFRKLARFVEQKNFKTADAVLAINEKLREYTLEMGAPREKTSVIRAGVDHELFKPEYRGPMRKELGFADEDIVLFFMGWLYDFTGLKEVAGELVRSPVKNIKLFILGKGDLCTTLQEIQSKQPYDGQITLKGWVPYQDVPKFIMACDVCILPAYKNDIMMNIVPIKLYEYMAAGKPVIATNLKGLKKEFGENNGIIYIENPNETIDTVTSLIREKKLDCIGLQGYNFVKNNSWKSIVDQFEAVIQGKIDEL